MADVVTGHRFEDRVVACDEELAAVMRGRPMQRWLWVAPEHLRTTRELATWVQPGPAYSRSLPAKR